MAGIDVRVLDTLGDGGAQLIEIAPEDLSAFRAEQPGLRIAPVRFYSLARAPRPKPIRSPVARRAAARATPKITIRLVSGRDGSPLADAEVTAFTDWANEIGDTKYTNRRGEARLDLGAMRKKLDRLYIYPRVGHWSLRRTRLTITSGTVITLRPIDLSVPDALRHFYPSPAPDDGAGVRVAVIDTGVGPHDDLAVEGGSNCVLGEDPSDFVDNGDQHGTHVAGIIASRGSSPTGMRGVAPAVALRSYRVFPAGKDASNFDIAKAIDAAASDRCDLINLSLESDEKDEVIESAIITARAKGCVVIVAAGNGGRDAVCYPASDSLAIGVSAMGRRGTFPRMTAEADEVRAPFGTDRKNFVAALSNVGAELDLTGPGVGIISTVPGGHAVMDGTSMACPAVTGAAARLLARNRELLDARRDQARSDRITEIVLKAAKPFGFGPLFEGQGALL